VEVADHPQRVVRDCVVLDRRQPDALQPGHELDEKAAFYKLVEALEDAKEIAVLRMALDDDPARFGEPTPYAAGDHTG
jgi:hypothetical protein